jgi:hypothetical protein
VLRRLLVALRRRLLPCPHPHRYYDRDEHGRRLLICEVCDHRAIALAETPEGAAKRDRLFVRLHLEQLLLRPHERPKARRRGVVVPIRARSG